MAEHASLECGGTPRRGRAKRRGSLQFGPQYAFPGRFLTAVWRHLLVINFEVDPGILESRVPTGLELDLWNGRAFVSVVGFLFIDTRLYDVAIPFHAQFEEVNLRYYVRRPSPDDPRRGVVFVKEVVPRRAVATVARWAYNENYAVHAMRHEVHMPGSGGQHAGRVAYTWKARGRWNRMSAEIYGEPALPLPGSDAEFITEHYWGYGVLRDRTTLEYRVEHPRWQVCPARDAVLDCDARTFYGEEFGHALTGPPCSAFMADGSAVSVYRGVKIGPTRSVGASITTA